MHFKNCVGISHAQAPGDGFKGGENDCALDSVQNDSETKE
jgi:hypothetical protein